MFLSRKKFNYKLFKKCTYFHLARTWEIFDYLTRFIENIFSILIEQKLALKNIFTLFTHAMRVN
jgi:hypothetical protein